MQNKVVNLFKIKFTEVEPTTLKKWATGSGAAKKEQMEEAFIDDTKIEDFRKILGLSPKSASPITDIIDAYFLCKYAYVDQTVGIIIMDTKAKKKTIKGLKPIKPIRYKKLKKEDTE